MKFIFLDVDGVIKPLNDSEPIWGFNAECLANLKLILDRTKAKIVLSTSWRDSHSDVGFIMDWLDKAGINKDLIVGCTPNLIHLSEERYQWDDELGQFINTSNDNWTGSRGHEIFEWMKMNSTLIDKCVILDDDPLAAQHEIHKRSVMFCHCDAAIGLTAQNAKKAVDFLIE